MTTVPERKRLFLDIETSQMLVWVWSLNDPANQHISHLNIEKEPGIICIAWKWAGKKKVSHLTWDENQNAKKMLVEFAPLLESADEIIVHNANFDIKWIRGQCLINRVLISPKLPSVCTLQHLRQKMRLPSNRLDYVQKVAVGEGKRASGLPLWHAIQRDNCPKAMAKMVRYCKGDVIGLEKVYDWMAPWIEPKTSVARYRGDCPECGGSRIGTHDERVTAAGAVNIRLRCYDCGKSFTMGKAAFLRGAKIQRG